MQESLKETLKERQRNGECAVCGEKINEKAIAEKDYVSLVHSEIGAVLIHKNHLK